MIDLRSGDRTECVAGILVGGLSRRMGTSKALLRRPDGLTLIEHAVRVVRRVASETVLLGGLDSPPVSIASLPILPDPISESGPLSGLLSLTRVARSGVLARPGSSGWTWLVACDMPHLSPDLWRALRASADPEADAVAFSSPEPGIHHACCALYHARLAPLIEARLRDRHLSLQRFLREIRLRVLTPSASQAFQLANVNTPEEWLAARERLRSEHEGT